MKALFFFGIIGLVLFEIANVYFIMPIPGSQEMNSIDLAYGLHSWRWAFRIVFGLLLLLGAKAAWQYQKWLAAGLMIVVGLIVYETNAEMAADHMFYQPNALQLTMDTANQVGQERLVLAITHNGESKAYPIQFLGYHHQVRDSIGGKPIMVTYCTVCRTGRVFEPIVNGRLEEFRLVGMDHFNAMFEDQSTKSWWRQATGEAVAGPLKGQLLPEFPSTQTTLKKWLEFYPDTRIMQPDPAFQAEYDSMATYEKGRLTGKLTRRDTTSWQPKSWVIGVRAGDFSKAYDWNQLQQQQIIHDVVGTQPLMVILSADSNSFVVLERPDKSQEFTLRHDSIIHADQCYNLLGESQNPRYPHLKRIQAYQEYWHSWQTFHPDRQ